MLRMWFLYGVENPRKLDAIVALYSLFALNNKVSTGPQSHL